MDVGSNPGTLLELVSSDIEQCRVQMPREIPADVGSIAGTLLERVSSDKAQCRVQSRVQRLRERFERWHTTRAGE